jgi:hypothetical protein
LIEILSVLQQGITQPLWRFSGSTAAYLAEVVKNYTGDNQEANIIAHAVVNAAIAAAQGRDAPPQVNWRV